MAHIGFRAPREIDDPECRRWLEDAIDAGKPGPEYQSIRSHQPGVMRSFTKTREWIYHDGLLEFELKELVRAYIALSGDCAYCSNQGVARAINQDDRTRNELLDYAHSDRYTNRQKLAFRYADAIMWDPDQADEAMWSELKAEFSEPELVELGYWIGFTFGGQRWLRTLGASQGQLQPYLDETGAGLVVGAGSNRSD